MPSPELYNMAHLETWCKLHRLLLSWIFSFPVLHSQIFKGWDASVMELQTGVKEQHILTLCKGIVSCNCLKISTSCPRVCIGMDETSWTCLGFILLPLGEFLCWDTLSVASQIKVPLVHTNVQVTVFVTFCLCCNKMPKEGGAVQAHTLRVILHPVEMMVKY